MIKLFKYGGEVSENLITVDSADITFAEFFNRFDREKIGDDERNLIHRIDRMLIREDVQSAVSMSDDRLIYVGNMMMVKYPDSLPSYGLNEWFVSYEFLKRFYDKSLPYLDDVIRFMNLWIGARYSEGDYISGSELNELREVSKRIKSSNQGFKEAYDKVLPSFVLDKLEGGLQEGDISEDQIIKGHKHSAEILLKEIVEYLEEKHG